MQLNHGFKFLIQVGLPLSVSLFLIIVGSAEAGMQLRGFFSEAPKALFALMQGAGALLNVFVLFQMRRKFSERAK